MIILSTVQFNGVYTDGSETKGENTITLLLLIVAAAGKIGCFSVKAISVVSDTLKRYAFPTLP